MRVETDKGRLLYIFPQIHILSRGIVSLGLYLLKHLPLYFVDNLMVMLSKLVYGDVTKYGLTRPHEGPFYLKVAFGKYPVIDVGTYSKIKTGEIQVFYIQLILSTTRC